MLDYKHEGVEGYRVQEPYKGGKTLTENPASQGERLATLGKHHARGLGPLETRRLHLVTRAEGETKEIK